MIAISSSMKSRHQSHVGCREKRKACLIVGSLALLAVWMTGCSLPPGIRYLQSLPKGALQTANPQDVRVAINLPSGITIKNLEADIIASTKDHHIATTIYFRMVPKSDALAPSPVKASGVWTFYAISPESMNDFKEIQVFASRHLADNEQTTVKVNIHNKLWMADCGRKGKVPLVAAILLHPSHGYGVIWNENDPLSHLASRENRICTNSSAEKL
ncbi:MAG: hypothetical protein ACRESG_03160 [Gammaproteobacteria bacterium]